MNALKDKLLESYKISAQELKKGNPRGYEVISNTLISLVLICDDREIMFHQAIICGTSTKWLERQTELEDGKKALKDIGILFEKIAEAYNLDETSKVNELFRDFVKILHDRWQKLRLMKSPSCDEEDET